MRNCWDLFQLVVRIFCLKGEKLANTLVNGPGKHRKQKTKPKKGWVR